MHKEFKSIDYLLETLPLMVQLACGKTIELAFFWHSSMKVMSVRANGGIGGGGIRKSEMKKTPVIDYE